MIWVDILLRGVNFHLVDYIVIHHPDIDVFISRD